MELDDLLEALNAGNTITGDSPLHEVMHRVSQEACALPANSTADIRNRRGFGNC